jgi:hypothetical protein
MSSEKLLNYRINAYGSSPPSLWLRPDMIIPDRYRVIIDKSRSRMGGRAHLPRLIIIPSLLKKTRFPYENGPVSSWETIIQDEKVIAFS